MLVLDTISAISVFALKIDKYAPMEHTISMDKMLTIVEFSAFQAQVGECITLAEKDDLFDYLAREPEAGEEIKGTGGIRKLRWGGKGKGKRGGLRVIYYFYNESAPLFLLTAYGKSTQEDLTPQQKKQLTKLTEQLKSACKNARQKY